MASILVGLSAGATMAPAAMLKVAIKLRVLWRTCSRRSGRPDAPALPGHHRLVLQGGVAIAQVVRWRTKRRVDGVARLTAIQGAADALPATAYSERCNATFRTRLSVLMRRMRAATRPAATIEAGMWLVGTYSNFCWTLHRLRRWRMVAVPDPAVPHWVVHTPTQAAGLTDHRWSFPEFLIFPVPPVPPDCGSAGCYRDETGRFRDRLIGARGVGMLKRGHVLRPARVLRSDCGGTAMAADSQPGILADAKFAARQECFTCGVVGR